MALTVCPECSNQISDKATDCIHCGFPIQKPSSSLKVGQEKAIELTSKRFKIISICAGLAILLGIILAVTSASLGKPNVLTFSGAILFMGGIWVFIINRVRIWWHHR